MFAVQAEYSLHRYNDDNVPRTTVLIFSIAVHGAPYSSQSAHSALRFARAVLDAGHRIHRVFFYHEGVLTAGAMGVAPQDELDVHAGWAQLQHTSGIELAVCIATSLKRGMLSDEERQRYDKPAASIHPNFTVVGLGQLIEAVTASDRFVTFAA